MIEDLLIAVGFNRVVDEYESQTYTYRRNNIEIFRYRVMFGYRLRAGFIGRLSSELDICCGAQDLHYNDLLTKIATIIINNPVSNPFKNIPMISKIKPYFNDDEFLDIIEGLYSACSVMI